ncbi:MAG: aspartate/glutamate racemase family protein [Pseudomonadota bacterium]
METVLVVNPNSSKQMTEAMLSIVHGYMPDAQAWTNVHAPNMITGPEALEEAAQHIAKAVLPKTRAVIVAAFGDAGATALVQKMDVPVIGIGAAAARAAGQGGARFAVLTTTPRLAPAIDVFMQAQGVGYLDCDLTDGDPQGLLADPAALDRALICACQTAARA